MGTPHFLYCLHPLKTSVVPELKPVAFEVHHDHLPPIAKSSYGVSLPPPHTWAGLLVFAQAVFPAVIPSLSLMASPKGSRATLLKSESGPN